MMKRFSSKIGAIVLLSLSALYALVALTTGHSAASEPPPDLSATEAGLDVWRAAALMLEHPEACVVDVRDAEQFELYHLPRSKHVADEAEAVRNQCAGAGPLLLVAQTDAKAAELAGALRHDPGARAKETIHFLQDGARSWYLTFALPVPLFADKPAPFGYQDALKRLDGWLTAGTKPSRAEVDETIGLLLRAEYRPTALTSKRKKASGKKTKKISGGCG